MQKQRRNAAPCIEKVRKGPRRSSRGGPGGEAPGGHTVLSILETCGGLKFKLILLLSDCGKCQNSEARGPMDGNHRKSLERFQGEVLVGVQGAKPPEALRFWAVCGLVMG